MAEILQALQIRLRDIGAMSHLAEEFHHLVRDIGVEDIPTGDNDADRIRQLLHAPALEQISARPVFQCGVNVVVIIKRREDNNAHVGISLLDRFRAEHTVKLRHAYIHEDNIDGHLRESSKRLAPIRRHRRDLHILIHLKYDLKALPYQFLIVSYHDADHTVSPPPLSGIVTSTVNPAPLRYAAVPCRRQRRSCM